MNIIIGTRRLPKKFNVPHSSQEQPNDDNASGKYWGSEKLTDRKKVHDARKRQRAHKVRSTSIAEVA
jgi:hypothetical protein